METSATRTEQLWEMSGTASAHIFPHQCTAKRYTASLISHRATCTADRSVYGSNQKAILYATDPSLNNSVQRKGTGCVLKLDPISSSVLHTSLRAVASRHVTFCAAQNILSLTRNDRITFQNGARVPYVVCVMKPALGDPAQRCRVSSDTGLAAYFHC